MQNQKNLTMFDAIRAGDRITIVNRFGQEKTGRAVMYNPQYDEWVLNMGGAHGTPANATRKNVVKISPKKNPESGVSNPNKWGDNHPDRTTYRGYVIKRNKEFGDFMVLKNGEVEIDGAGFEVAKEWIDDEKDNPEYRRNPLGLTKKAFAGVKEQAEEIADAIIAFRKSYPVDIALDMVASQYRVPISLVENIMMRDKRNNNKRPKQKRDLSRFVQNPSSAFIGRKSKYQRAGIAYWKTPEDAFKVLREVQPRFPEARVVRYEKGYAVQIERSGDYLSVDLMPSMKNPSPALIKVEWGKGDISHFRNIVQNYKETAKELGFNFERDVEVRFKRDQPAYDKGKYEVWVTPKLKEALEDEGYL